MNLSMILKRHWFLFFILIVILLAEIYPSLGAKGGPLKPEITIKYGAVCFIFFLSGFTLTTEDIVHAAKQYNLHLFIQTFTLLVMPIFVSVITYFLEKMGVDEWVCKGLVVVSCMPPSFSSAVIITRAVGGNEAAAIFNAVLGSVLGIITTPFTLLFFLHTTALVPPVLTILDLMMTVTLPLALGHALQYLMGVKVDRIPTEQIGNVALLLIIYTTFCDTFISHESMVLNPINILITIFLVVVLQLFALLAVFCLASLLGIFYPKDIVTIMFSSTHKSLTLGIPILRVLYSGYDHLTTISLPLLVYHPTQIILGSLLVGEMRAWLRRQRTRETDLVSSECARPGLRPLLDRQLKLSQCINKVFHHLHGCYLWILMQGKL